RRTAPLRAYRDWISLRHSLAHAWFTSPCCCAWSSAAAKLLRRCRLQTFEGAAIIGKLDIFVRGRRRTAPLPHQVGAQLQHVSKAGEIECRVLGEAVGRARRNLEALLRDVVAKPQC